MKWISKRFRYNGLFTIMFFITIFIITIVSVAITWATIRMSENFFYEKFSIMNAKVMSQVKDSMEYYNYSIVLASNNLLQNGTVQSVLSEDAGDQETMEAYYTLGQQMKRLQPYMAGKDISVLVMGKNGLVYTTDRSYWPISDMELKDSSITEQTMKQPRKLMYHYHYQPRKNAGTGEERFMIASKALMQRSTGNIYGAMYFAVKESEFKHRTYDNYTSPGNDFYILDRQGTIISSSQEERIGTSETKLLTYAERMEADNSHYLVGKIKGKEYLILKEYLPFFDMYMFNVIDKETAFGDLIDKKNMIFIVLGIVLLAVIIVFLVTRRVTNSLSLLVRKIINASKNDFDEYVPVSGTYETKEIGQAFNLMLDEIQEYMDELVLSQQLRRNAELAALQQQINPHFLYNTLTSIKFMVQQGEKAETEATIHALISLLQNTVGNVSETITVAQEVENLKHYVLINQKRYGERIKVNYFISPDCLSYKVPKLVLQPFMENAFFHGFNQKHEGSINVLIWKDGGTLICETVDNGDGMEISAETKLPKQKRKQQLFSGIGVKNVHERIQLMYGEEYGVTISSELGEGTKVHITMPINKD
ncbi:sensor histidine kinase [Ectobacillus antri]|uniref:Sensor histidine kinase n=1 Tax=Ectobacillus antri TaxID=2486280 RepID=A0ABT6H4S2_9BACI|nr:sensor histidine kinase [Ectobacillus antri]MDG4657283.1 sensor histidine kinase [Ectobacillus antri]MDG5754365.1 sensor histidine kinase [Ectobacillus antri]